MRDTYLNLESYVKGGLSKKIHQEVKAAMTHLNGSLLDDNTTSGPLKHLELKINKKLQLLAERKADSEEVKQMVSHKTNKADSEMTLTRINNMHEFVKSVALLIQEQIRAECDGENTQSLHAKRNNRVNLLQQALYVTK